MGIEKHDGHDPAPAAGLALDLAALTRVLLGVTPGAPVVPDAAPADEPEREPVVREEQGHGGLNASRRCGALLAELSFLDD